MSPPRDSWIGGEDERINVKGKGRKEARRDEGESEGRGKETIYARRGLILN